MENTKPFARIFIGIDVSKATLEIAYPKAPKGYHTSTVDNAPFSIWKLSYGTTLSYNKLIIR